MVNRVLVKAGFEKNKTYKETRFLKPPQTTYAIYLDDSQVYGSDDNNYIIKHTYTIEMYAYTIDRQSEKNIEKALKYYGIDYDKDTRYWIDEEQLYQTIYTFEGYEKVKED